MATNSRVDALISFFTRKKSALSKGDKWAKNNIPWTRRRISQAASPVMERLKEGRQALERHSARAVVKNDFQRAAKGGAAHSQQSQRLIFEKAHERLKARAAANQKTQALSAKPAVRPISAVQTPAQPKPIVHQKPMNQTQAKPVTQPKPARQPNSGGGKKR